MIRTNAVPPMEDAKDAAGVTAASLTYLRTHRNWYARASTFHYVSLNALTSAIIVLGALTSIISATGPDKVSGGHVLTIVLPAVSSLAATLLVQFRVREMCRARELGRLACEGLICDALALNVDDADHARAAAVELRRRAHAIEREQLDLVIGSTTIQSIERGRAADAPQTAKLTGAEPA